MKPEIERVIRPRELARKSYNAMSRWYDLFTNSEKRFTDIGIKILDVKQNESVLEIGCGTGHALTAFTDRKGGKVIAMDISEGMIKVARRRIQNKMRERSVEFCQADGLFIPFPDEYFDTLFLSFTLELFDTPEIPRVLRECNRVLKTGGRIGVVSLAKQNTFAVRVYEWFHRKMPNFIDCRPIFAKRVLQEARFIIQFSSIETMWGLPVEIITGRK